MTGSLVSFPVLTILILPSPTTVRAVAPVRVHGTVAIGAVRRIIGDVSCLNCQATKMTEPHRMFTCWQLQRMPVGTAVLNCVYSSHSEHLSLLERAMSTFPKAVPGAFLSQGETLFAMDLRRCGIPFTMVR